MVTLKRKRFSSSQSVGSYCQVHTSSVIKTKVWCMELLFLSIQVTWYDLVWKQVTCKESGLKLQDAGISEVSTSVYPKGCNYDKGGSTLQMVLGVDSSCCSWRKNIKVRASKRLLMTTTPQSFTSFRNRKAKEAIW